MTSGDLEFAHALRDLIGWNQTINDWQRLVAYEPKGCFVAEWEGSPAGTATTTCYGTELAWIGMVLVHPQYRRRGIGKALLEHCLEHLRESRISCIKLDATPLGKPLYEQLGFREEWALTRWSKDFSKYQEEVAAPRSEIESGANLRSWKQSGITQIGQFDSAAFGVSRERMLELLAQGSKRCIIHTSSDDSITGYGMLRAGSKADYLGPLVATSDQTALALISTLLSGPLERSVYWDIPDANVAAVTKAKDLGFAPQRPLLRMHLGRNENPGQPASCFGIADPAIG